MTFQETVRSYFSWARWEHLIRENGISIDRPYFSTHPVWEDIIYPINYGYICNTTSSDGEEIDIFVGTAPVGLVGLHITQDYRKGDREVKLMYNCTPEEVYLIHGFVNYNPKRMDGILVMRNPMHVLWKHAALVDRTN